ATLQRLGGAAQIVRDNLESALAALTPAEQDVAASMFDHLVTPSGTKIAHVPGDLAGYAHVSESELRPVLSKLGEERILRSVAADESTGTRYEIFHDVLAEAVLAWKLGHEADRQLDRQRAAAARRQRRLLLVVAGSLVLTAAMVAVAVFALT